MIYYFDMSSERVLDRKLFAGLQRLDKYLEEPSLIPLASGSITQIGLYALSWLQTTDYPHISHFFPVNKPLIDLIQEAYRNGVYTDMLRQKKQKIPRR